MFTLPIASLCFIFWLPAISNLLQEVKQIIDFCTALVTLNDNDNNHYYVQVGIKRRIFPQKIHSGDLPRILEELSIPILGNLSYSK